MLDNVILPKNLKVLKQKTFGSCSHLIQIVLSDKLNIIGKQAFSDCVRLHQIVIPSNVSLIEEGAFDYCHLSSIDFKNPFDWQYNFSKLWLKLDKKSLLKNREAANLLCNKYVSKTIRKKIEIKVVLMRMSW